MLHILCDKAQAKSLKASELARADSSAIALLAVDVHEVRDTKSSFKKLCKACVPSASQTEPGHLSDQQQQQALDAAGSQRGQSGQSHSNLGPGGRSNFRRSSHKKFNRLTSNGLVSQFNTTSVNVNGSSSLSGGAKSRTMLSSHVSQSGQLTAAANSSAVGFHKLLNDSKWFEQLQVSRLNFAHLSSFNDI